MDDDGKVYFYWGCSNETPMWGVELDPQTMNPKGEKKELIYADPYKYGYERIGDDNGSCNAQRKRWTPVLTIS